MDFKMSTHWAACALLFMLFGCGMDPSDGAQGTVVLIMSDAAQDSGVEVLPDEGIEYDPEACEVWLRENRTLVDALVKDTVTDCTVGSYGRCGDGQLFDIQCGDARHTWCGSTNENDPDVLTSETFDALVNNRCQVAPPGCHQETENQCDAFLPFCMPDGECVLLEDRTEGACDDIRAEAFASPSMPQPALCDSPERVCTFTGYAACYSEQCSNRCPLDNRFACIDEVPVAERKETLICQGYTPFNCEGFHTGRNTCEVEGAICIESHQCADNLCGDECMATICVEGAWVEVPRKDHAADCQ